RIRKSLAAAKFATSNPLRSSEMRSESETAASSSRTQTRYLRAPLVDDCTGMIRPRSFARAAILPPLAPADADPDQEPASVCAGGQRQADELGQVPRPQLAHDVGAMGFRRADRDSKAVGNDLVLVALDQEFEHLELPFGEGFPGIEPGPC